LLSTIRYEIVSIRSLQPIVLLVFLAGCGGTVAREAALPQAAPQRARACHAGSYRLYGSSRLAYAAVVRSHAVARRRPGGRILAFFGRLNANGVPTVFLVRGALLGRACSAAWYRVELPIRPNGATGWVRSSEVVLATVRTRFVVDLSARRVELFRNGRLVVRTTAAIGAAATPTPTGRFYVNQRLVPADPAGPFGPAAIGISAFSNVLTGWTQGGPVAIHGTDDPSSIGRAVSNGCIRIPNAVVRRIFREVPAGTPVLIRA
jgi:lipoprotein-anchoring transpeptidase ErfK/SrfK